MRKYVPAARLGDGGVEIFQHDFLLTLSHCLSGRCALRTTFRTASAILPRNGLRFGSLPSLVIGMYGVVTLMRMVKFLSFGAFATVWARAASENVDLPLVARCVDFPGDGVRLTTTVSRMSELFSFAQASTTNGISASGSAAPNSVVP